MKKWKDFFQRWGTMEKFSNASGIALSNIRRWSAKNKVPANRRQEIMDFAEQNNIHLTHDIIDDMQNAYQNDVNVKRGRK